MLTQAIHHTLHELSDAIGQLQPHEYTHPFPQLRNATIGEHTRHIIELFQCLIYQYETGVVNYDLRERNPVIQGNIAFAQQCITEILSHVSRPNCTLELQQQIDGTMLSLPTNFHRELLYNLEHCIHHQALIRVGIMQFESVVLDPNFGVARSTIAYRQQCAP